MKYYRLTIFICLLLCTGTQTVQADGVFLAPLDTLKKAAGEGNPAAQYNLGTESRSGGGIRRPPQETIKGVAMSTETNKTIIRRLYDEFFNKGDLSIADELHAADFVYHEFGAPAVGLEEYKKRNSVFFHALPDRKVLIEDLLAEGDKVVARATMRATQTGDLPNIPATGRPVTVTSIIIYRISEGKIAEEWESYDQLGMLKQLGASLLP